MPEKPNMFKAAEAAKILAETAEANRWPAGVQTILVDLCATNEILVAALKSTQMRVKQTAQALAQLVLEVRGEAPAAAQDEIAEEIAAGAPAEAEAEAAPPPAVTAPVAPKPVAPRPVARQRPAQPPQRRQAPKLSTVPTEPRMGADGQPMPPEQAALEAQMDAAIEGE